jgi:ketosteroid isomerase-like protein
VERANAHDAEGMAELYADDAVLGYPAEAPTVGRAAIKSVCQTLLEQLPLPIPQEEPLPTIRYGDIALTSTRAADGTGGRVQVAARQPDGTWLRIIDRPEVPKQ